MPYNIRILVEERYFRTCQFHKKMRRNTEKSNCIKTFPYPDQHKKMVIAKRIHSAITK